MELRELINYWSSCQSRRRRRRCGRLSRTGFRTCSWPSVYWGLLVHRVEATFLLQPDAIRTAILRIIKGQQTSYLASSTMTCLPDKSCSISGRMTAHTARYRCSMVTKLVAPLIRHRQTTLPSDKAPDVGGGCRPLQGRHDRTFR